jgi:hypothetical protein
MGVYLIGVSWVRTSLGVRLMDVYLISVCLMGVHLTERVPHGRVPLSVYLIGVCPIGVYLMVVCLMGVHLTGPAPHGRVPHGPAPHGRVPHGPAPAPYGCVPYGPAPWACTSLGVYLMGVYLMGVSLGVHLTGRAPLGPDVC